MASIPNSVFGACGVLLILIVLQNTAADPMTVFKVPDKVRNFIRKLEKQHKTKVSSWDMYGKEKWLADRGEQYKKYQVTANTEPMKPGAVLKKTVKRHSVYVTTFSNEQPAHEQKVLLKRTTRREKEASWFSTKSIEIDLDVRASLSLFDVFKVGLNLGFKYDLKSGERHLEREIEEFTIQKEITIPPLSKVEVEWVIAEYTERCEWKADVVLDGWFALQYERPVHNHRVWFHPIDAVRDPDLTLHDPSGVVFTAEGLAEGVTAMRSDLYVRQYSLEGPQNDTAYAVPLNGNDLLSTTLNGTSRDVAESV